jgi:PAS domain S-box-containing protein
MGLQETLTWDSEWLRVVLDTAVDGVIVIDASGTILVFNPACERLFGYRPDEAVGRNVSMLMPRPWRGEHAGYLDNYTQTGERKIIGIGREVQGQRKDGSTFPMELSVGEAMRGGKPLYVGTIHDITERKQSEEQRRLLIEQLVASNEERGHFSHVASHDMQEHLRMVLSFSAMLAEEYGDRLDTKGRQYLLLSLQAARQMRELVDDLVAYERLTDETGHDMSFDAGMEVKQVCDVLKDAITASGAQIVQCRLPRLTGSAVRFRRLMQNLLGNALKYMPAERVPRIEIGVQSEGCHWRFCVKDNGIGIEPAYFRKIFEPFKRLHSRNRYQGSGLGLAICEKIVMGFGGRIWVESEPGKGSSFFFTMRKQEGDA